MGYLNDDGLEALWGKIVDSFATKAMAAYTAGASINITNRVVKVQMATYFSPDLSPGSTLSFIDSISQAADGTISATKRSILSASANSAGLVNTADNQTFAGYKVFQDGLHTKFLKITSGAAIAHIEFSRSSLNYIVVPNGASLCINTRGTPDNATSYQFHTSALRPYADKALSLGDDTHQWATVYGNVLYENKVSLVDKYLQLSGGTLTGNLLFQNDKK